MLSVAFSGFSELFLVYIVIEGRPMALLFSLRIDWSSSLSNVSKLRSFKPPRVGYTDCCNNFLLGLVFLAPNPTALYSKSNVFLVMFWASRDFITYDCMRTFDVSFLSIGEIDPVLDLCSYCY